MSAELWTAIGSAATAITVGVLAIQVWLATKQEKTEFEDGLVKEYRELLGRLPPDVLLQASGADAFARECMREFYRYFDLCNEQIFLRQKGRVRKGTWQEWQIGIRANMLRPGFRAAWAIVEQTTNSFAELRCLQSFQLDPKSADWKEKLSVIQSAMERKVPAVSEQLAVNGAEQNEKAPVHVGSSGTAAEDTGVDE